MEGILSPNEEKGERQTEGLRIRMIVCVRECKRHAKTENGKKEKEMGGWEGRRRFFRQAQDGESIFFTRV